MADPEHFNPRGAEYLRKAERVTRLLDSRFRIPGTNFRFGLDPILGLIPFAGDAVSLGMQAVLISSMLKHGASRKVFILMALNILLDFAIGSIPVIGNIFDFFYKSNERNFRLLKTHYEAGQHQGKGNWIIFLIILVLVLMIFLIGFLVYIVLDMLIDWLQSW